MKKVLILENGKTITRMVSLLFKNEDYKFLFPENHSAKTDLSRQIPDLIIADLTSIKNKNVELLMQLKNNPVISMVPFLLITSPRESGSQNKKIEMAEQFSILNYYLNKPFTNDELFSLIKRIIDHIDGLSPW